MAFSFAYGTPVNDTSAGATLNVSVTAAVGTRAFIAVASDNAGTSGVSAVTSITDAAGNTWSKVYTDVVRTAGASNDGTVNSLFSAQVTNALSASTVTVNFSPNVASKAAIPLVVSVGGGNVCNIVAAGAGATGNGTTHSITSVGVTSGHAVIGVSAIESDSQPGADADSSNGTWNSGAGTIADPGPTTDSQGLRFQHKVTTGTGDQSFDTTSGAARDFAVNIIVIEEAAAPTGVDVTPAAGAIEIEGLAPTVGTTGNTTLSAPGAIELVGLAPTFTRSTNIVVSAPGTARLIGYPPTVTPGISWPPTLPIPLLSTHGFVPRPQVLRTEMEQGAARVRRLSRVTPYEAPFSLMVDQGEMATLEAWVDDVGDYGGRYFSIRLKSGTGYRSHIVRFMGEIDYKQVRKDRWLATGTFEMEERPMLTEAELDALLEASS